MTAALAPTELAPGAGGELEMRGSGSDVEANLEVSGLPETGPDEYYELWFDHEGGRVCAGTFVVDNRGRGEFSASCPEVAGGYQRGGITLEVPKASLSHLTTLEGGLLRLGLEYLYLVSCFSRSGTQRRPC